MKMVVEFHQKGQYDLRAIMMIGVLTNISRKCMIMCTTVWLQQG